MRIEERIEPTKERLDKGDIEVIETERGGRETRVKKERTIWPLNRYCGMRQITREQWEAGNDFNRLFQICRERSRCAQWRYTLAGGVHDPLIETEADRRYAKAYRAIRGEAERQVTVNVCGYGKWAGEGKVRYLRSALDDLIEHFKKEEDERLAAERQGHG